MTDEIKKPEPDKNGPREKRLVGVKFRTAGRTYFFEARDQEFCFGDQVIVETENGSAMARIITPAFLIPLDQCPKDLKPVLRKANRNDLEREKKNREREERAYEYCVARIKERNVDMKLVRVEYLHDGSRVIFYYTAGQRVDFRDLVKDLAHDLHTRIEMRQIGVRDEAKLIGGLGNCGRGLCCASFLTEFASVSVKMVKDQNLAMNPAKVSGVCGRLMCCLAYEHCVYQELLGKMPRKGSAVDTPAGRGRVVDLNPLAHQVTVQLEDGQKNFKCEQVKEVAPPAEPEGPEDLKGLE